VHILPKLNQIFVSQLFSIMVEVRLPTKWEARRGYYFKIMRQYYAHTLVVLMFLSFLFLRLLHVNVCPNKTHQLPKRDSNIDAAADAAAPDFVKFIDEPFVLVFPSLEKRAVIGSAISVPSQQIVVFIVVNKPWDNHLKREELPEGFRCAFGNRPNRFSSIDINDSAIQTPLHIHAERLQNYGDGNIWACDWPSNDDDASYNSVAILAPSTVNTVFGNGVFHIVTPETHGEQKSTILSCVTNTVKNLHGDNNRTARDMQTYINHYRRLGVNHFVFYTSEHVYHKDVGIGTTVQNLINLFREAYLPGKGATMSLYLLPSSYAYYLDYDIDQDFTGNHCLYVSREAGWILGQFDFDEILVGVQNLNSYLHSQPLSAKLLHVQHYLPQDEQFPSNWHRQPVINISSDPMPSWGKSFFRPEFVNVSWVHEPTNPKLESVGVPGDIKLLHYRRDRSNIISDFHNQNMTWREIDLRDSLPT